MAMTLANFARFDPDYEGSGLSGGGQSEEPIWIRYSDNREELHSLAEQIRAVATGAAPSPPLSAEEGEAEAEEGRILFRRHRVRERDPSLARKKKGAVLDATGSLRCEVCELDAAGAYGDLGSSVIECHHLVPISKAGARTTRLSDLALVCRNCHAAIHAEGKTRSLDEIRAQLETLR